MERPPRVLPAMADPPRIMVFDLRCAFGKLFVRVRLGGVASLFDCKMHGTIVLYLCPHHLRAVPAEKRQAGGVITCRWGRL